MSPMERLRVEIAGFVGVGEEEFLGAVADLDERFAFAATAKEEKTENEGQKARHCD